MNSLGSREKSRKCEQKIEADPGNDMTIADSYNVLNIKKSSILDVASFLDFRISQISNTNPKYKKVSFLFCSLNTWFTNVVLFPWFQASARMWHCLYAYCIVGGNDYGLSKLVAYGSIFILCSFFSCTFFGCLHPNGKGVTFWEEIITFWNQSFHTTISTDIHAGRTFVNLLISWQSFI